MCQFEDLKIILPVLLRQDFQLKFSNRDNFQIKSNKLSQHIFKLTHFQIFKLK
jgi:hypothetical protein